jgi:steroid delta-isomerase-like uncharacterized protein
MSDEENEQNKAIVRRFYDEIMNQGELSTADEILAPDFVMTLPGYRQQGIPAFKGFVTGERIGFPDYYFTLERIVADDGKVAVRWNQRARQMGHLHGIPPTWKMLTDEGISIFHITNGKIETLAICEDALNVLRQMGAVGPATPAPPEAAYPPAPAPATQPQTATAACTPLDNKALIQRYYDAIMNGRDLAAAPQLMDPTCVSEVPTGLMLRTEPLRGPEAWVRSMRILLTAIPDLTTTIDDEVACGDTVVVRWTWRGTNTGKFGPLPPSNKSVTVEGITWYRIVGGKLVENLINEDQLGFLRQVGAIPAADNLTAEENKALVHRFFDGVWNHSDYSLIDQFIAPNFIQHFPGAASGREGFRNTVTQTHAAFGQMQVVIDDEIAEADRVVHRWTWNCTQTGAFAGIPATGKKVSFSGMTIVRLAGGQIIEHWATVDTLSLLEQLGAIPAPQAQRA